MTKLFQYKKAIDEFLCLLYPNLCIVCQKELEQITQAVCSHCELKLPYTYFHKTPLNNILKHNLNLYFDFKYVSSLLFFSKTSPSQAIIHRLKYDGQEYLGHILGHLYANQLINDSVFWQTIDLITIVPLSQPRLKQRGYNQNNLFAQVLSERLNIPIAGGLLKRRTTKYTQASQTSRFKRWGNTKEVYQADGNWDIDGKHILIIDDVVTTGSTLEACATALTKYYNLTISVLTMATPLDI